MELLPDSSIDLILSDPPYGSTQLQWDTVVPLDTLWRHYKRVLKPTGVVVLTAVQPFTSLLGGFKFGMAQVFVDLEKAAHRPTELQKDASQEH